MTDAKRFWFKVDVADPNECWEWRAAKSGNGGRYGYFHAGSRADGSNRQVRAHRWAYEWAKGPIPKGLQIDHLCRNPACVNPEHLEAVSGRENLLRGDTFQGKNARKTHCVHGHPFDGENTRYRKDGTRECKTCRRAIKRRWRERQMVA